MSKKPSAPLPYYDQQTGQYWLALSGNNFMKLGTSELKLHLRRSGLNPDQFVDGLNEVETAIALSHINRAVDYSGPLAGHKAGPFETSDGRKILVTNSPRLITPKRGKTPTLMRFWRELLGPESDYFHAWMQIAYVSLVKGDMRPGQLLALAGEAGCGKSLAQQIITEILGGRVAKPYRFMIGADKFNGDLATAEHWCIEDEHASTDIRTRRKFGTSIKDVCANRCLSIRGLFKQGITLPIFRRITLSVNRELENLQIIPPLDGSLLDKITLLICGVADVDSDRNRYWNALTGELPGYLHWLLNEFDIPKSERCTRYGVKSYQNPDLYSALVDASPEHQLLTLIDEVHFSKIAKAELSPLVGSTSQIEQSLRQSSFCFAVDKLLYFSSACGVYLQRLETQCPERVSAKRLHGKAYWTIKAPALP